MRRKKGLKKAWCDSTASFCQKSDEHTRSLAPHKNDKREHMLTEDKRLKGHLILQSFCPLFVLIFIKHVGYSDLVISFFRELFKGNWSVLQRAINNPALGDVVITILCIVWFLITAIVALGFRNLQTSNFASHGETIIIAQEKKDSGVTFLVTFVLPLLVDDVSTLRGFLFFAVLLFMVIFLLIRSDLFYQNPVLVALRYKAFEFQLDNPYQDVKKDKTYIGLTKGDLPVDDKAIKRRYIADDVFLIYNE